LCFFNPAVDGCPYHLIMDEEKIFFWSQLITTYGDHFLIADSCCIKTDGAITILPSVFSALKQLHRFQKFDSLQ
jgi:hypothetical protein